MTRRAERHVSTRLYIAMYLRRAEKHVFTWDLTLKNLKYQYSL